MKAASCNLPKQFVKEEAAEGHESMKRLMKKDPRKTARPSKRDARRGR